MAAHKCACGEKTEHYPQQQLLKSPEDKVACFCLPVTAYCMADLRDVLEQRELY